MRAAAVADHALTLGDGCVVGYAAPAAGRLPCLLRLEADGEALAIARATRFAGDAARLGLRLGWCGVALDGLDAAAVLADRVVVRCAVSGRPLLEADAPPPSRPPAAPLSVFDILDHARRDDACADPATILPFAEATLRREGIAGLVGAAFRSLLGREADPAIVACWLAAPPAEPVRAVLTMILTSAEFRGDRRRLIPGPFHPAFAFDLSPLDG